MIRISGNQNIERIPHMTAIRKNPSRPHPAAATEPSPAESSGWDRILADTPAPIIPEDLKDDDDIDGQPPVPRPGDQAAHPQADDLEDADEMPPMLPPFGGENDPDFAAAAGMPAATDWSGIPDDGRFSEIIDRFDDLRQQMGRMEKEFQSKLKYDAHKNKIIDELHSELQAYKDDIIKKHIKSFVLDLIQFSDNLRKLARHYENMDMGPAEAEKLFHILESLPSDIEDILLRQGVESFESDGDIFNPARQRVLKRIPAARKEKNGHIAERMHPGFEWDDVLLRPELVSAYIHQPDAAAPSEKEEGNE